MGSVRARLSGMMFLQYFVWGGWGVAAGGYLDKTLKFSGDQISTVYLCTAIGAIFSPLFVGYVADRFFSTERILAALHFVGGLLLIAAATQKTFLPLMTIMVVYALCYMPTLALTNSISFLNIGSSEREFPRIRVWGTIGWIVAGLVVGIILGGTNNYFFYLSGGASIVLALWCLLLPHTPPRGAGAVGDVLGLEALQLLKQPSFLVFVVASFLICIPLAFYYAFANAFLTQTDQPAPTALQTIGQFSEILFMTAMPFFIVRLGVKNMLLVGMLAWVARYLCFSTLDFSWILVGLVLHGVCYDFFFVASQIYVDKKSPRDLRSSAQSFIAFVTLGLGMAAGTYVSGRVVEHYKGIQIDVEIAKADGTSTAGKALLPEWAPTEADTSIWRFLDLSATINNLIFGPPKPEELPPDFAKSNDANEDGVIEVAEIPDSWKSNAVTYSGQSIRDNFATIDLDGDGKLTRVEWRAAQANNWQKIWLIPAMMAGATALFFWLAFHDKVPVDDAAAVD